MKYRITAAPDPGSFRYEEHLNEEQLAVVMAGAGVLLVIAGAGTGKTRTLIYRVARLVELGVPPRRISLCTFTNKAAREMLNRADALVGARSREVWGGTFHHLANRLLREWGHRLGYAEGYTILDEEDARDLLTVCIAERERASRSMMLRAAAVAAPISMAVNTRTPLDRLILQRYPELCPMLSEILEVARRYRQRKRENNVMDFDDLLHNLRELLEDDTVRAEMAERFEHVLVDEYQDTNRLQAEIVDRLASVHRNLMVVGDDAQSIYGFRGAEPENILGFSERWTDAALYRLTINYRSTPQILEVANACIRNNRRQVPKDLQPVCPAGERPALVPVRDSAMEAAFVAQRVLEKVQEGQSLDQMAVLYRAHFQSMELQLELTRRQIPFRVRSGIRFFEQAHIKDVLAFLRLLVNPQDELSWVRVLNLQPGVGRGGALKLFHHARTAADPVAEFAARPPLHLVAAKARNPLQDLAGLLGRLRARENPPPPSQAIAEVLAGGYRERLPSLYENAPARSEELDHLAQYAERFESLEAFLAELNLLASFAAEDVLLARQPEERLTLSTVHQAKGLEWQTVFVIGLSESLFPHARSLQEPGGEEEERRLFYVAATRAARELYLVVPQVADRPGGRRTLLRPSRFVDEVQRAGCLERWSVEEAP